MAGLHWITAVRQRQVVCYPVVELSYRASSDPVVTSPTEAGGPALKVILGDRAEARVGYTVRFRLVRDRLRLVHDRFGTMGYWSAVRDNAGAAIALALAQPNVTLDSLYPGQREELEQQLKQRVAEALEADGMQLADFSLGAVDLGRAGEIIQATLRARLELAREEANAAIQQLRVRNDAELTGRLADLGETALRYREAELWRDLTFRPDGVGLSVPMPAPATGAESSPAASESNQSDFRE